VKKKPKSGDYRIDMDQGGTLAESILTQREKKSVPVLGRKLKSWGVRLAAVDLIDGKVTDLNFTSPGLLVPMEALLKRNLAAMVVKSLIQPAGKAR
jgi:glutathione synthase/RimK-type ligase-like ATP-grasp enzyme